jgi:hypothetical protein
MATLSATATWRETLVSEDPAPARSRGTTSMTEAVAAGITIPMAAPWMANSTPMIQIGESVPRVA